MERQGDEALILELSFSLLPFGFVPVGRSTSPSRLQLCCAGRNQPLQVLRTPCAFFFASYRSCYPRLLPVPALTPPPPTSSLGFSKTRVCLLSHPCSQLIATLLLLTPSWPLAPLSTRKPVSCPSVQSVPLLPMVHPLCCSNLFRLDSPQEQKAVRSAICV